MRTRSLSLGALLLLLVVTPAGASIIEHAWDFPTSWTNWSTTAELPQFHGSAGSLTGVFVQLTGSISGDIEYESRDAEPATIDARLSAAAPSRLDDPRNSVAGSVDHRGPDRA